MVKIHSEELDWNGHMEFKSQLSHVRVDLDYLIQHLSLRFFLSFFNGKFIFLGYCLYFYFIF